MSDMTPPALLWHKIADTLRYYTGMIDDWKYHDQRMEVQNLWDAQAITSQVRNSDMHKIAIDIDMPASLVPSSTQGHFHLYIDREITWEQYSDILKSLGAAGILQEKYVMESIKREFTALRMPWVHKEPGERDSS